MHLVIPAPLRHEVAVSTLESYDPVGVTHLLISKLDEVEGDGRRRAGNRIVRHLADGPPVTLLAG